MRTHQDNEAELDRYIDSLNAERRPGQPSSDDVAGLLRTVRSVKALKDPAEPSPDFESRLLEGSKVRKRPVRWWAAAGVAVAAVLLAALIPGLGRQDVAVAMARAIDRVERYNGTLEVRMANAAGQEQVVRTREVWVEGPRYAVVLPDGTTTVNNGDRKWQVRPADRLVAVLPVAPDPQRIGLDLKEVGAAARRYTHRVLGEENVAGRPADVLEITPPGGDAYRLWVDRDTDLPVRLVTAMQNALQTTYTYTQLAINQPIEAARFTFTVPEGYRTVEQDPGQQVETAAEAAARLGFQPILPAGGPARMIAYQNRLVLEYGETTVVEAKAEGVFTPATYGAIGSAAGGPLEVLEGRLRWRQEGLEITVAGPNAEALARSIAPDLRLPEPEAGFPQEPKVKVAVDLEIARNDQRQVDGGHSPWQLDPEMVTMAFLGAQSVTGVSEDAIKLASTNGARAVVDVSAGPVSRVYLERLVRQDNSGIWSVVGYDPR
jgi:outer membrane lipoprotein-sorting protein